MVGCPWRHEILGLKVNWNQSLLVKVATRGQGDRLQNRFLKIAAESTSDRLITSFWMSTRDKRKKYLKYFYLSEVLQ